MKKSLTETVIEQIKYQILSGEYSPGDKLPTLRELCEIFDVSRSVINAVVVDLESNGYIKTVPTKWIEVADWKNESNFSILADLVTFGLLDEKQLKDILDARKYLELECTRKACENANESAKSRMQALLIEEAAEHDPQKRAAYDLQFHYSICRMSGNIVYGIVMQAFENSAYPLIVRFYEDPEVYEFVLKKHGLIAKAILENNKAEAEKHMKLLLEHGENIILKLIKRR